MKKKILFITPDLRFGGTNSSLSNIYNIIKGNYEIDVFSLYNKQIGSYSFRDRILRSGKLLYWYYCYYSDLKGVDKIFAFIIKIITRICLLIGINFGDFLQKREVRRISRNHHYDLVIGFQEGAATLFASRFKNVKKMAWIHCDYSRYYKMVNKKNEEAIYDSFNKIVCVSNYTARSFVDIYPSLKEKVINIYNPYDEERVIRLSKELIEDSRFDTSCFTILSVGRIDKVKRFSMIPQIANRLKEKNKAFRWYIIGNVVDLEEYDTIMKGIKDYKLENYVFVLNGKKNPYPYFAQSNLLATTSSSEACPIVFLEAQTFNIPIITTSFGSSFEFVEHGKNGYITPLDNFHTFIIEVMEGRLGYQPVRRINNKTIIDCLNKEIISLLK